MESGFQIAWPWMLFLLPLPFLIRLWIKPGSGSARQALLVPFFADLNRLEPGGGARTASRRVRVHKILIWLAWLLLVLASTRPQWLEPPQGLPISGRDLMLAVDLSGSMEMKDFKLKGRQVDRLTAIKGVALEFIDRRIGDRLGLILFGDNAYLQTPLTFDLTSVKKMLLEAEIGLAGEKTAIGDAIGLAIKRLRERPGESRVLVLLTDGANTAGVMDPAKAAQLAAREGIRIYTIGMGSTEPLRIPGFFGSRLVDPSRDLDEGLLTQMAEETGGRYFRASDTASLAEIYHLLDELEPTLANQEMFVQHKPLFPWFLAPALVISLLLAMSVGWNGASPGKQTR
ncbi:MAG: VWA domain-containing protein [Magnetococcales bacterium]|nr:VWA domain-containing protein [Magnetococcales bacterium]